MLADGRQGRRMRIGSRQHLNRSTEGIRAVNGRRGTEDHFDAVDTQKRGRNLAVVMAALTVVEPQAAQGAYQRPNVIREEVAMRRIWQTGTSLVVSAVAFVAVVATPSAREQQAMDPNVTVDPAILSTMQFRHLSVFSRGGRSTAVTGVPSNPTLFYIGTTGGGVFAKTNCGEARTKMTDGFLGGRWIGSF